MLARIFIFCLYMRSVFIFLTLFYTYAVSRNKWPIVDSKEYLIPSKEYLTPKIQITTRHLLLLP